MSPAWLSVPDLPDQGVLALEFVGFQRADRADERCRMGLRHEGGGQQFTALRRQFQIGIDEIRMHDRRQVVQAGQQYAGFHQVRWQRRIERRPQRRHHHRRQMRAGRMAGDDDALRVKIIVFSALVQPCNRVQLLARDVLHADRRCQPVIGQHHVESGLGIGRHHEREIGFVARAPPAAVDEDQQRCAAAVGGEEVKAFSRRFAIGQIQQRRFGAPHMGRIAQPACQDARMIGDGSDGVVLFGVISNLVVHGNGVS